MNSINNPGINLLQDLPVPDDAALEQSRKLGDVIRDEIAGNHGRISFRRFMEMALYQPGLGYYSGGARKFGAQGDFTTAPELSPLFSACVARQCEQIFIETGTHTVLELGAGTGIMAADLLTDLQRRHSLPETYMILETSADLRQRQQQLLKNRHPDFYSSITWLDTLPAQPVNGIILANEVLDAMPVHRVKITNNQVHEFMVVADGESFGWQLEPAG
ncbi:MAG: SAM-dependent methyltransferase, partial [Gammaproteobacteria bacterium]